MNEYDSDKMADVLNVSEGIITTDTPDDADIILFNTCSVREKAQEKVFSELGRWRKLKEHNPDLIIGNKEENEQVQIEELKKKYPVWMSEIKNFEDAFEMMTELGKITGNKNKSIQIVNHIKESIAEIKNIFEMKSIAYFIWYEPMMFAGRDTFINNILNFIGLKNVAEVFSRYPELDEKKLMSLNPEFCFLSSEPYPFKDKHKSEIQKMLPHTKILFVNGEMFSWYGTRMMKMSSYIKKLRKEINSI